MCQRRGEQDALDDALHEIEVLRAVSTCPDALHIWAHQVSEDGEDVYALLDYCQCSLPTFQQQHPVLAEKTIFEIFGAVCRAVHCLHSMSPAIVHR